MLAEKSYVYIPEAKEYIENLLLMTQNRKPNHIFLISSNQLRLIAAKESGFCAIPIMQYQQNMVDDDKQLNLVENYLIKLRYSNDMMYKNNIDFGFLTRKLMKKKALE